MMILLNWAKHSDLFDVYLNTERNFDLLLFGFEVYCAVVFAAFETSGKLFLDWIEA